MLNIAIAHIFFGFLSQTPEVRPQAVAPRANIVQAAPHANRTCHKVFEGAVWSGEPAEGLGGFSGEPAGATTSIIRADQETGEAMPMAALTVNGISTARPYPKMEDVIVTLVPHGDGDWGVHAFWGQGDQGDVIRVRVAVMVDCEVHQ